MWRRVSDNNGAMTQGAKAPTRQAHPRGGFARGELMPSRRMSAVGDAEGPESTEAVEKPDFLSGPAVGEASGEALKARGHRASLRFGATRPVHAGAAPPRQLRPFPGARPIQLRAVARRARSRRLGKRARLKRSVNRHVSGRARRVHAARSASRGEFALGRSAAPPAPPAARRNCAG